MSQTWKKIWSHSSNDCYVQQGKSWPSHDMWVKPYPPLLFPSLTSPPIIEVTPSLNPGISDGKLCHMLSGVMPQLWQTYTIMSCITWAALAWHMPLMDKNSSHGVKSQREGGQHMHTLIDSQMFQGKVRSASTLFKTLTSSFRVTCSFL